MIVKAFTLVHSSFKPNTVMNINLHTTLSACMPYAMQLLYAFSSNAYLFCMYLLIGLLAD